MNGGKKIKHFGLIWFRDILKQNGFTLNNSIKSRELIGKNFAFKPNVFNFKIVAEKMQNFK